MLIGMLYHNKKLSQRGSSIMQFKSNLLIVTCMILLVPLLINCSILGPNVEDFRGPWYVLFGTWDLAMLTMTADSGNFSVTKDEDVLMVVIFSGDFTYDLIDNLKEPSNIESGVWSVSGNVVTLASSDLVANYSVSGNDLTLTWTSADEEEFPGEDVDFVLVFTKTS